MKLKTTTLPSYRFCTLLVSCVDIWWSFGFSFFLAKLENPVFLVENELKDEVTGAALGTLEDSFPVF